MTVTFNVTADGGGGVGGAGAGGNGNGNGNENNGNGGNGNGRRVLMPKTDSANNVNNNNGTSVTGKAPVLSVRRVLFGPPADPAQTRAWLERQLYVATSRDANSWNFDFINERPLRDSPDDRYVWERVTPPQCQLQKSAEGPAAAAAGSTAGSTADSTAASPQERMMIDINQRQSKLTDYLTKTKKRPFGANVKPAGTSEGESTTKRGRHSLAATMAI